MAKLPDGFELDALPTTTASLPAGFQLDEDPRGALTVDNVVRSVARGIPILGGAMDNIAAAGDAFTQPILGRGSDAGSYSERYNANLAQEQAKDTAYDEQHPIASTAGQVGGAVLATAPLVAAAPAAFGAGSAPLAVRAGASAVTGGVMGGADAAVRSGGDIDATKEGAAWGFGLGLGAPVAAAGVGKAVGAVTDRATRSAVPAIDDLRAQAQSLYDQADNMGIRIGQPSFAKFAQDTAQKVGNAGIDPTIHPAATAALRRIEQAAGSQPTLGETEILRRIIGGARGSMNADERRIASIMQEQLDDYVTKLQPADVVSGNPSMAAITLAQARNLWSRAAKAQTIEDALYGADLGSAATGSGGNIDNATRQKIKSILLNAKQRGFTPEEREAMEKLVKGSKGQNALRLAGKLSPQGNGLMAALGVGGAMTNPVLGIPSLVGLGAKAGSEAMTKANATFLQRLILNGGAPAQSQTSIAAARRAEELARFGLAPAPLYANQLR